MPTGNAGHQAETGIVSNATQTQAVQTFVIADDSPIASDKEEVKKPKKKRTS